MGKSTISMAIFNRFSWPPGAQSQHQGDEGWRWRPSDNNDMGLTPSDPARWTRFSFFFEDLHALFPWTKTNPSGQSPIFGKPCMVFWCFFLLDCTSHFRYYRSIYYWLVAWTYCHNISHLNQSSFLYGGKIRHINLKPQPDYKCCLY